MTARTIIARPKVKAAPSRRRNRPVAIGPSRYFTIAQERRQA